LLSENKATYKYHMEYTNFFCVCEIDHTNDVYYFLECVLSVELIGNNV